MCDWLKNVFCTHVDPFEPEKGQNKGSITVETNEINKHHNNNYENDVWDGRRGPVLMESL